MREPGSMSEASLGRGETVMAGGMHRPVLVLDVRDEEGDAAERVESNRHDPQLGPLAPERCLRDWNKSAP